MFDYLKKLNFTDNEINLYLWLLENGEHTAAEASRALKMDKSSAYRAAENLTEIGAVFKLDKKRGRTYEALNPEILKDVYNQKKSEILGMESGLDNLILNMQTNFIDNKNSFIKIEHGFNAHLRMMELSLEQNPKKLIQEFWGSNIPILSLSSYSRYSKNFEKKRVGESIKVKCLSRSDTRMDKILMTEIKIIPPELTNDKVFRMFGEYVEIISSDEENDLLVTTIKNKAIKDIWADMFGFIWDKSKALSI